MDRIEQLRLSGELPSPKGVALAIMEISRREDASLDEVARVVQTDPALAGRLLRQANAAAHSGRAVASINEAVLRLGMATVRQLAMGFSLVDQYSSGPCKAFDYRRFWSHSLLMAVASQEFGSVMRVGSPDELFACGLLARVGRLALATVYPADYADLLGMQVEDAQRRQLERERLGIDETEFTAAILADCGIPNALAEPILFHEAPDASGFAEGSRPYQIAHLFHGAGRLADLGLSTPTERHGRISELMRLGGQIGLDADELGSLFDRIVQQWQQWSELLNLPADSPPTFSNMANAPAARADKETGSARKRVLVVDDDPTICVMLESVLGEVLGCTVYTAGNGKEALALALEYMPQIVVTDWLMPVVDGLEFCRALRATDWGRSMYVIMLTGVEDEDKIVEAFEAGVDDYVSKPVNVRALTARMRAAMHYVQLLDAWERDRAQLKQFAADLAISNRRMEHAALTDLLTGLPNRRAGMEALAKAWSASQRNGQPLAALEIDVDNFKAINDRYGHAVGDIVLQAVAKSIHASARRQDNVSRFGGEEFLLVCHDADARTALLAAERLRKMVSALSISTAGLDIRLTVSIGVGNREPGMTDPDQMVQAADKALYAAKNAGRDRVCLCVEGKTRCAQRP
jgi:diguanylate cyclase (GGDEF)-like protein